MIAAESTEDSEIDSILEKKKAVCTGKSIISMRKRSRIERMLLPVHRDPYKSKYWKICSKELVVGLSKKQETLGREKLQTTFDDVHNYAGDITQKGYDKKKNKLKNVVVLMYLHSQHHQLGKYC